MIGGVSFSLVRSGHQRVHRGRREIARGTAPILFINVQMAGRSSYLQGDEEIGAAPGDIFLIDPNRPFQLGCEAPFAQLSVKFPLDELRPWRGRLGGAAGLKLERANPYSALLRAYASAAFREAPRLDRTAQLMAAHHLCELIGCALGSAPGAPDARDALRAATYLRACAAMRPRIGDADLSPRTLARAAGVSERLLHRLFQERGETVMSRLRAERLDLAARLLSSDAARPVTDIAFSCGFKDTSHFGRAFTARFGQAPSKWRDARVSRREA